MRVSGNARGATSAGVMGPAQRTLTLTALAAVVALVLLVTAGVLVRRAVSDAFEASQRTYEIKSLADSAVKLQLDEETGIRGLAATANPAFLQPFAAASAPLEEVFAQLQSALSDPALAEALPLLADARATNARWNEQVARPIEASPRAGAERVQLYGKSLMDRYRADFARIDVILEERSRGVAVEARRSIDRINVFLAVFVGALALAAIAYGFQQIRVARRLSEQEHRAEDERRQRAELRAAYEAEKRVADTLQEAFTQRPLPLLETLRFSASYVPATEDTKVGGDWYDAMALARNRVLFAIGDVTGHGIEAAVTMNRARQSLISSALLDADPASVLSRVNGEIFRRDARLVTAIAGVADATTYEFSYAIAGHPPPVLLEPGRKPRFLEFGSVPLGALASPVYVTRRVQSVPGATLVLYTDGAVEHSRNVLEGEEMLLQAVAEAGEQTQADPAAFIHRAIFQGRPVGDDVAILTVGFATGSESGVLISADKAQTGFSGRLDAAGVAAPFVARQQKSYWARRRAAAKVAS